jgi:hypothetical protein
MDQQQMKLLKVEQCIAWAAQQGYIFAQDAAHEYGMLAGRIMVDDDNTAMYGTHTWRDKTKDERRVR